jgi:hypothetical protein
MDQYSGLKVGDDASDAGWIAEQMRRGILPESYVYPPEVRYQRFSGSASAERALGTRIGCDWSGWKPGG